MRGRALNIRTKMYYAEDMLLKFASIRGHDLAINPPIAIPRAPAPSSTDTTQQAIATLVKTFVDNQKPAQTNEAKAEYDQKKKLWAKNLTEITASLKTVKIYLKSKLSHFGIQQYCVFSSLRQTVGKSQLGMISHKLRLAF